MKTPVVLVITKDIKVYYSFEEILRKMFGTHIHVVSNHFSFSIEDVDVILCSGHSLMEYVNAIKGEIPVLLAARSIEFSRLERLMDLVPGTRCLLVSNSPETAVDSVELLQRLGFDHLNLTPFWPDMDQMPSIEQVEVAITHGLPELIPSGIERTVDLGIRNIDLSTILDISRILQLSIEKSHLYTADFFRNFVRMGRRLSNLVINEQKLNQQMEAVLNGVHEGIIGLDKSGMITVFNKEAGTILGISVEQGLYRYGKDVIPDFKVEEIMVSHKEVSNQIIPYRHMQLLVTKTPMVLESKFIGAVITFQDVTSVQRVEQEIRRKSVDSGLVTKYSFGHVVGNSPVILQTKETARKIARSDYTVLLTGENGTGKEIFAQAIHDSSPRREGPFVAVNFAGLSATLAESELFGYEEGAFTGAKRGGKIGLFELAQNGTIFLDEIGDAPLSIQAALLRVLQERQVMRVGGNKVLPINIRVIAATNKDLQIMIRNGTFREDLFYRLNELPLVLPSLQERKEDLFVLVEHFLSRKQKVLEFTSEAREYMTRYSWPGNVRELEAFINYLMVTVEGSRVELDHLPYRMKEEGRTAHSTEVSSIIQYLLNSGLDQEYVCILELLSSYSPLNAGMGRKAMLALIGIPLTEAQIRSRIDQLARLGCVLSGVKRQGTKITPIGQRVLQQLKQTENLSEAIH